MIAERKFPVVGFRETRVIHLLMIRQRCCEIGGSAILSDLKSVRNELFDLAIAEPELMFLENEKGSSDAAGATLLAAVTFKDGIPMRCHLQNPSAPSDFEQMCMGLFPFMNTASSREDLCGFLQ